MKVGVLIVVALALLVGFVVVMGGLSFQSSYMIFVDFDNPGGLKTGAPVRIAGVKIGRVSSMEFRGASTDPKSPAGEPYIRVVANIDNQFRSYIHDNGKWFVTTQGVLGEFYLGVDPGTSDHPVLPDGAIVHGLSPPRLDLLLSEAYELLHSAYVGISDNREKIAETFDDLHRTLKGTGDFFERNGPKLDHAVDQAVSMTDEAHDTLSAARAKFVDNPHVDRILANADSMSSTLAVNLPPLLQEGRRMSSNASELLDALASKDQIDRYKSITRDAAEAAGRATVAARDAQDLIAHVRQGKGTVGAFVMDEAVYDDVQELLRDIKHNPWKLFWRE
jgi:phospholipid/cholesterol/gamma-HCH transport system substrate-binding protein